MFLAESHLHTDFSPDCRVPMAEMAAAAAEKGAAYVCFTDHIEDCSVGDPTSRPLYFFDRWEERAAAHAALRERYAGRMDVALGAEIDSINHRPERAKPLWERPDLDFIIGSIHGLADTDDFYLIPYDSLETCLSLTERYFREYAELGRAGCCDVLGHLGYTKRYMARAGFRFDIMQFEPLIRDVFRVIIPKGIGIEVNTSGLRDALGEFIPTPEVLKLYREMGGEIVTLGSDAHTTDGVCAGIEDAQALLRSLGYRYFTVFHKHKPDFIKL